MKIKPMLMVVALTVTSSLHAQQNNNQYYQEQQQRQQQQHAAEQARQGYMNSQQQAPQQPTGEWRTTWGAIATDNVKGVLGSVVERASKNDASNAALAVCRSKGGVDCKVDLAYFNQCAAMVVGAKEYRLYGAATVDEAAQRGLNVCNKNDSNCRVYFTECSKPIFARF